MVKQISDNLAPFFHKHWHIIIAGLFVLISFFHIWQLADLPRGLYVDESSIGLNAAEIAESGHDEHGYRMPIYFEAFGEYKNPVYIYLSAFIFKILGASEFTLRLTSFIFFYLFLFGFYILVEKLFKGNKAIVAYSLISAGFLPWFFPMSRIAFEVISHLTVAVYILLFVYQTYHEDDKAKRWLYPLLTGLFIGLSIYTYSTARLLSLFMIPTLFAVYYSRKYLYTNLRVLAGFIIGLIPYLIFSHNNPGALTDRFKTLTYIFDSSLSFGERLNIFVENYFSYLSPNYFFYTGDTNLRHHIGYGGELFIVVAALALIGLVWLFATGYFRQHKYLIFLLISFLFSPIAAALTTGDSSLRSVLVGLYILIFSLFGLSALLTLDDKKARNVACLVIALALSIEVFNYLHYYFIDYPKKSIGAFESYDFKRTLKVAMAQRPSDIVVSEKANQPYAHLEFYRRVVGATNTKTLIVIGEPVAKDNRCIIFFPFDETIIDQNQYYFRDLNSTDDFTKLRCFSSNNPN